MNETEITRTLVNEHCTAAVDAACEAAQSLPLADRWAIARAVVARTLLSARQRLADFDRRTTFVAFEPPARGRVTRARRREEPWTWVGPLGADLEATRAYADSCRQVWQRRARAASDALAELRSEPDERSLRSLCDRLTTTGADVRLYCLADLNAPLTVNAHAGSAATPEDDEAAA